MSLSKKMLLTALPAALLASAAAAQQAPAPAAAQQAPAPASAKGAAVSAAAKEAGAPAAKAETGISAGAKVSDTKGGEVGTVSKVDGEFVILKTDRHEARLPVSSFAEQQGGLVIAMTRAELNAEVEKRLGVSEQKAPAAAAAAKPQ